jgi:hypothetical protein
VYENERYLDNMNECMRRRQLEFYCVCQGMLYEHNFMSD